MLQELFDELPSAPPDVVSAPDHAAGWGWLVILLGILAFELWAVQTKHRTLSQWLRGQGAWKWIGIGGLGFLIYHLL